MSVTETCRASYRMHQTKFSTWKQYLP